MSGLRCTCGHPYGVHSSQGVHRCTVRPAPKELAAMFGATTSRRRCPCKAFKPMPTEPPKPRPCEAESDPGIGIKCAAVGDWTIRDWCTPCLRIAAPDLLSENAKLLEALVRLKDAVHAESAQDVYQFDDETTAAWHQAVAALASSVRKP